MPVARYAIAHDRATQSTRHNVPHNPHGPARHGRHVSGFRVRCTWVICGGGGLPESSQPATPVIIIIVLLLSVLPAGRASLLRSTSRYRHPAPDRPAGGLRSSGRSRIWMETRRRRWERATAFSNNRLEEGVDRHPLPGPPDAVASVPKNRLERARHLAGGGVSKNGVERAITIPPTGRRGRGGPRYGSGREVYTAGCGQDKGEMSLIRTSRPCRRRMGATS